MIAIRKETKDKTQRRAPLSPAHVRELVRKHHIKVIVEPWKNRVFKDAEYKKAGAVLSSDLWDSNIIFGVKEIAPEYMYDGKAHCFFSHTIKGQAYNMAMLRHILQRRITLMDYELVRNDGGKRLILFGDFAGFAGMIDSLWALGRRLSSEGIRNPFSAIKYTTEYSSLDEAEEAIRGVGERIWREGLPSRLCPLVCAFTGRGHVASGAQRIFDLFPVVELEPDALQKFFRDGRFSNKVLYKVKFQKPDMFHHRRPDVAFDPKEFQRYPERYVNAFERYIPYLTMIVNGIFWEPRFPRLITKKTMRLLYSSGEPQRLRVIGDITCDIEGSVELTVKETDATNPVFVYDPLTGKVRDGWAGRGPVVLAVDKLPTELPREASENFGDALSRFVPRLARADFRRPLVDLKLPHEFHQAVIAHDGELSFDYTYLKQHLKRSLP